MQQYLYVHMYVLACLLSFTHRKCMHVNCCVSILLVYHLQRRWVMTYDIKQRSADTGTPIMICTCIHLNKCYCSDETMLRTQIVIFTRCSCYLLTNIQTEIYMKISSHFPLDLVKRFFFFLCWGEKNKNL